MQFFNQNIRDKMIKIIFFLVYLSLFIKPIESSCSCRWFRCTKGCGGKPPNGMDDKFCSKSSYCQSRLGASASTTTSIIITSNITDSAPQNNSIIALSTIFDYTNFKIDLSDPATIINLMANLDQDFTPCLTNCSNNGVCQMDVSLLKLVCSCNDYFTGSGCNIDSRPCSNSPCLNNATCINMNSTAKSYLCQCNEFYTGTNCESSIDLCQNETCSSNGKCSMIDYKPKCKCYQYYAGDKCEIQEQALATIKKIANIAMILAILIISFFCVLVLMSDMFKFVICRKKYRKKNYKLKKQLYKPKYVN